MSRAFVSVGSNIHPDSNVKAAVERVRARFGPCRISPVYLTAPVGDADQPDFWNLALCFDCDLGPETVQDELHAIEDALGRRRDAARPLGPRVVDLDLVLVEGRVGVFGSLRLPSPQLERDSFVAVPVADLDPGLEHPVLGVTMSELARRAMARGGPPPRRIATEPGA